MPPPQVANDDDVAADVAAASSSLSESQQTTTVLPSQCDEYDGGDSGCLATASTLLLKNDDIMTAMQWQ